MRFILIFLPNVKFTGRDESVDKRLKFQFSRTVEKPGHAATSGRVQRLVSFIKYVHIVRINKTERCCRARWGWHTFREGKNYNGGICGFRLLGIGLSWRTFGCDPWWKTDAHGWPIETVKGKHAENCVRILFQNIRKFIS